MLLLQGEIAGGMGILYLGKMILLGLAILVSLLILAKTVDRLLNGKKKKPKPHG